MAATPCSPIALLLMTLVLVASCGGSFSTVESSDNQTSVPAESASSASSDDNTPEADTASSTELGAIAPGEYCFAFDDGVTDSTIRLTIASDNTVTGTTTATIQDIENSYFTSYEQMVSGMVEGGELDLDVTTSIELDTQQTQETWQITGSTLNNGQSTFVQADCSGLTSENSLESGNSLDSSNASDNQGLIALGIDPSAVNAPVRVQFDPGSYSAMLENAVIRGTRDLYLLGAQAGQSMRVTITAIENNAVFDILSPNGNVLRQEALSADVVLPETGDYQIVVGGTRGNATYQLDVSIQ